MRHFFRESDTEECFYLDDEDLVSRRIVLKTLRAKQRMQ